MPTALCWSLNPCWMIPAKTSGLFPWNKKTNK
jgi:hypothetical protein